MRKKAKKSPSKLKLVGYLIPVLATLMFGHVAYQVYRKPLEMLRLIPVTTAKTVEQTWYAYKDDFTGNASQKVPARLLAAIAHVESSGDAWASPPWEFSRAKIFSPMSSAFGLMQVTSPTMHHALRLCRKGRWKSHPFCQIDYPVRFLPSHSISMSALVLSDAVTRSRRAGDDITAFVAVTHLCGAGVARRLVRNGFNLNKIGACGRHSAKKYVSRVRAAEKQLRDM